MINSQVNKSSDLEENKYDEQSSKYVIRPAVKQVRLMVRQIDHQTDSKTRKKNG